MPVRLRLRFPTFTDFEKLLNIHYSICLCTTVRPSDFRFERLFGKL